MSSVTSLFGIYACMQTSSHTQMKKRVLHICEVCHTIHRVLLFSKNALRSLESLKWRLADLANADSLASAWSKRSNVSRSSIAPATPGVAPGSPQRSSSNAKSTATAEKIWEMPHRQFTHNAHKSLQIHDLTVQIDELTWIQFNSCSSDLVQ
jgi:hypothetical protein